MRWIVWLRICKWALGTVWGLSLLVIGLGVWIRLSAIVGLGIVAMGEYVLMYLVLDDLVQPVNTEATGFLKLTAAMVFWISLGYAAWSVPVMLLG